jgi:5-methylcytosine-specific restriction endonuclease McrA
MHTPAEVAEMLKERQPEWEYVDGYTGCDGRFNIRHKPCGHVYEKSVSTARHGKKLKCECCAAKEREKRKERKRERENERARERRRIAKIWREFNKPVHGEQIQARLCPDCGAFYLAKKDKCPDCSKAEQKRYENRRKDLKRKGSHTEQSKEISAYSVYMKESGRCWLCGGQCDINADPNSDMYPSVDHILPQSLGGKDTWKNVHCAHRICNSMRGNDVSFIEPATALSPKV